MKLLRTLLLLLTAAAITLPAEAKKTKKEKEPEVITIYVFGVSQDLADSTIYVTNIAPVNGATMLPHNQLKNFQYYSEQLKKHVEQTYNVEHQTAVFFFARDPKKIERIFARTQEKMKKRAYIQPHFKFINTEEFHFKVPVLQIVEE